MPDHPLNRAEASTLGFMVKTVVDVSLGSTVYDPNDRPGTVIGGNSTYCVLRMQDTMEIDLQDWLEIRVIPGEQHDTLKRTLPALRMTERINSLIALVEGLECVQDEDRSDAQQECLKEAREKLATACGEYHRLLCQLPPDGPRTA